MPAVRHAQTVREFVPFGSRLVATLDSEGPLHARAPGPGPGTALGGGTSTSHPTSSWPLGGQERLLGLIAVSHVDGPTRVRQAQGEHPLLHIDPADPGHELPEVDLGLSPDRVLMPDRDHPGARGDLRPDLAHQTAWPVTPWTCAAGGRTGDPLYRARRILHTGVDLLADRQHQRLEDLFTDDDHVQVEATWGIYQRIIAAYREPDKTKGKTMMRAVIDSIACGVPPALTEIRRLGRTLKQRTGDILAFYDRPGTSNGPTEAINRRLEHRRGSALGFRNLTNYITRSLLETGGFRPQLHPRM